MGYFVWNMFTRAQTKEKSICVIFSSFGILIIMLPTSYHAKRKIEKRVDYYLSIFKFKRQTYFPVKVFILVSYWIAIIKLISKTGAFHLAVLIFGLRMNTMKFHLKYFFDIFLVKQNIFQLMRGKIHLNCIFS